MKATYIDHMGDDLRVVNAARVSFAKESHWEITGKKLKEVDKHLIEFLARGCRSGDWKGIIDDIWWQSCGSLPDCRAEIEEIVKHVRRMPDHWAPFAHPQITLRETMPIFVARQRTKHTVGLVYNEVSRRYVDDAPEFYRPDGWRKRAEDVKQGSADEFVTEYTTSLSGNHLKTSPELAYDTAIRVCERTYRDMVAGGVCPEQARMVLPQSMMTTHIVTGSLYAFANSYIQRSDKHAQKEIQMLARQWDEIIRPLFPVSWAALVD